MDTSIKNVLRNYVLHCSSMVKKNRLFPYPGQVGIVEAK